MDQQNKAYNLFFNTNLTQQQIAERIGISPRTLYDWIKNGNWKSLKATSRLMPAQIVDDLYNHITHLNYNIKCRDFEDRFPSKNEAETLRKLIFSIGKVKTQVSRGESTQALMNFVSWLMPKNLQAAQYIITYMDEYLHAGRSEGFEPYEFEFDANNYYNPEDFPHRRTHTFHEQTKHQANTSEAQQEEAPSLFLGKVDPALQRETEGSSLAQNNSPLGEGPGLCPLAPDSTPTSDSPQPIGSKSEVLSTQQKNTQTRTGKSAQQQISTKPTSETKNIQTGSESLKDEVQETFASWQKDIDKHHRKRRA